MDPCGTPNSRNLDEVSPMIISESSHVNLMKTIAGQCQKSRNMILVFQQQECG